MNSSYIDLYAYDHVYQLLFTDGSPLCNNFSDNPPMNLRPLKAHRGLNNRLIFRVLDPNRSPVNLCNYQVYARVIDPDNNTIVLEKLARQGTSIGTIFLELDSGDIVDLHAGMYNMVLVATQPFVLGQNAIGSYVDKPLFTDFTNDVQMTLEITDQAFIAPIPSVEIYESLWTGDSFYPTGAPPSYGFYSSAIAGSRVMNHKNSVHSFSTYTQNFTGVLEIFGTLDETPDPYLDSTRWFKIYPSSMSKEIEYFNYTGTVAYTFSANVMWIKFRYFPSTAVANPGRMVKLVARM